jgi:peptidylprolyl isomerase
MRLRKPGSVFAWLSCMVYAVLLSVAAAGCGGGDGDATAKAIPDSPPHITVPEGLPPKRFIVKDLRKGTGTEAKKGDRVMIQYYGVHWDDGTEHANSWRYSHIPIFKLGSHRLLRGLNMAIPGMREGGSREVIIPHDYLYYPSVSSHQHQGILAALIYRVYLVKVLGK